MKRIIIEVTIEIVEATIDIKIEVMKEKEIDIKMIIIDMQIKKMNTIIKEINITKNIKITLTPQVSIGTPITIQDLDLETETILITITKINIIILMNKEILIIIKITII